MLSHSKSGGRVGISLIALLASPLAVMACGDEVQNDYHHYHYYGEGGAAEPEAGAPATAGKPPMQSGGSDAGAGEGGGGGHGGGEGGDGIDPRYPDAPLADTPVADFELDLFYTPGNRYWFAVNEQQLKAMNNGQQGGCPFCAGGIYTPGDSGDSANYVDHLWVTTAGDEPRTADYGKVQVKIVGQSSRQPWDPNSIPNLNIDTDQFVKNQRMAGYEHLRFSNGQVGSIFRDRVAYDLYRALDYPAPLVTYAWVQSNVWGPDISIPYLLVERYKQAFCERNKNDFGGGCANIWEFASDFGYPGGGGGMGPKEPFPGGIASVFDAPENCQVDKCESGRANELEALMSATPHGAGYKAALTDYIDWPAYHRFQCLSWVVGTPDDQIHASNNVVVVERKDGLFQMLPYSVDISLNLWGGVSLRGNNNLSRGCQADPDCWEDTLDACEDLIADFATIKPKEMLKAIYEELEGQGMLRRGDAQQYQSIDEYLDDRLEYLPSELQLYREGGVVCELPYVECNGECVYEYCPDQCIPPGKPGEPVAGAGPIPMPMEAGGAASAGGAPGVAGTAGIAGGIVGGGGPIDCPKAADKYAVE
jgi:hypothetical protein